MGLQIGRESTAPAFGSSTSPLHMSHSGAQARKASAPWGMFSHGRRRVLPEDKQKHMLPLKAYAWKSHPATSVHIPLAKASYMAKAILSRAKNTFPMDGRKERKGICAEKCSDPL